MKPVWAKLTFWRRLAGFHPAIQRTALETAFRSGAIYRRHADLAAPPPGSHFTHIEKTTAHPFWADAFEKYRAAIQAILEIGAFEGRTTVFAAQYFPNARVVSIDPWAAYAEMDALDAAEKAFRQNTAPFGERVTAIKGYSSDVLPGLVETGDAFDIIFVDGSHAYDDVVVDTDFAWRLLKTGGVIIWDDYLWRRADYGDRTPKRAIDEFLTSHEGEFQPLWAFKQVAIRKTAE